MSKDLLLELGLEEIPARFIRGAMEQMKQRAEKWFEDNRIAHSGIQTYATPRRLTIIVRDVAEKQADFEEEAKGPSRKIAMTEQGEWTKAALGFARSNGIEPSELYLKEVSGVEYVFAKKSSLGVETGTLLEGGFASIVQSLTFPRNMKWGSHEFKFVRPIRWIVSLYGRDIVPMEICGVHSGNVTRGHRFLGAEAAIDEPSQYVEALKQQYVIADVSERKQMIERQIIRLAERGGWTVPMKDDLLEEVLFLVEYPTALFGSFDPKFLDIPHDVLITSMREHQRYFPVHGKDGQLLPHFVTVRNGNDVSLDLVAKGNEKVLRARLSDAKFFYEEDQKMPIDSALAKLETVLFHEELGTIGDKVRRIGNLSSAISSALALDERTRSFISRTAALCKFDLVTQMVYEFPELQGVMGDDYARKAGEPEEVARGIFEHYAPRFSGDAVPSSVIGAVVSIADKIDSIVGCFQIGIIPTGSQDPYALRRQAAGIVQILFERKLGISLDDLFELAIAEYERANALRGERRKIVKDLMDFFALRVKNMLSERGVRYDAADAVMLSGFGDIVSTVNKAAVLMEQIGDPAFKVTVDSFTRVMNLAAKSGGANTNPAHYAENAEHELHDAWQTARSAYKNSLNNGDERAALDHIAALKDPINRFFDSVMVMTDDEQVRNARLGLLNGISNDLKRFADFPKLIL